MYSREIDGRVLALALFGWNYDNTFVLYDKETNTLWHPYEEGLKGIQGRYFERWLPELNSEDTEWDEWHDEHPDSRILKQPAHPPFRSRWCERGLKVLMALMPVCD